MKDHIDTLVYGAGVFTLAVLGWALVSGKQTIVVGFVTVALSYILGMITLRWLRED